MSGPNDNADADALAALMAGANGDPMPDGSESPEAQLPAAEDPPGGDPPPVETKPEPVDTKPAPTDAAGDAALEQLGLKPKADEAAGEAKPGDVKPDAAKDAAQPKPGEATPDAEEPARDEEVEKEITERGLKGTTADRFRELSARVAAAEPIRAELEQLGVRTVEEIQELAHHANTGIGMVDLVRQTGATSEDYSMALDWLTLRSRGRSGDRAAAEEAFETIATEYKTLATLLGREVPGVYDPLESHQDLLDQIESLDITRAAALEIAHGRNRQAFVDKARQQQADKAKPAEAPQTPAGSPAGAPAPAVSTATPEALDGGRLALNALGPALQAEDPARLAHYLPTLRGIVATVKAKFPHNPEQWVERVELEYRRLPAVKPEPTLKPTATPTPRPGGAPVSHGAPLAAGGVVQDPAGMDPEAAMWAGINSAR